MNSVMNRACLSSETFYKFCFKNPHLRIIKGECWKNVIIRRSVPDSQPAQLESVPIKILSVKKEESMIRQCKLVKFISEAKLLGR